MSTKALQTAERDVAALEKAVCMYQDERGMLPLDLDGDGVTDTDEIIAQLVEWDLLPANFPASDPWGHKYVIVLQRDYPVSAATKRDFFSRPLNDFSGGFQVFSMGPDGATNASASSRESSDDIGNCAGS